MMDGGREFPYPPAADGLTYGEAGYERRAGAPGVFFGFWRRDCKYSMSPAQEEGSCGGELSVSRRLGKD